MCQAIMYEEVRYLFMSRQLLRTGLSLNAPCMGIFIAFEMCDVGIYLAYTTF